MNEGNLTAEDEATLREQLASELWEDGPPADHVDAGPATGGDGSVEVDIWSGVSPLPDKHISR